LRGKHDVLHALLNAAIKALLTGSLGDTATATPGAESLETSAPGPLLAPARLIAPSVVLDLELRAKPPLPPACTPVVVESPPLLAKRAGGPTAG
jgi:hypothetical protein